MPELPEVEAALEFLRSRVRGRTILGVRLLHPSLQRRLAPEQLRALAGARITRVERRGKHQLLHLDDGRVLHAHFRMNGDWALAETAAPLPRFARAAIDLDDATSLMFVDSRALGTIDLHPAGVPLDLGLGPDAADPEWTAAQLADELALRRGPIKPALLDQRLVAGLGNIYAAESLWRARISPFASCNAIPRPRVIALREAIDAVLRRATGSRYTDDDTVTLDVYDREGLPCRRCRTPIERAVQAGRSTYFCPTCQPSEPAPRNAAKKTSKKTSNKKTSKKKTSKQTAKKSLKKTTKKAAKKARRSRRA
ncbi:MAG TPA: bifunctional DNA-formamidopyrimidine glycosylase/DNA-(apurinic or apyrimidinic site) lyase [Gemmatimonadaceae bacterium]